MADEAAGAAVPGQVGVAALAAAVPATGLAHEYRRIAASVQKHHGLLAARKRLLDRFERGL